jgi:hypothetical protein
MPAFYRLPAELLTMITQYVTAEKKWVIEGKALRLTHPHFANLDYLNAHLFYNINFHATPEGLDRLKAHPQALKPFVRKVTFLPSEYGTDMTFFHFRRIVIKQCAFYCPTDCTITDHSTRRGVESIMHLESAWAKDPLFSPEELLASYQEYRKQAQAAQALLANGSLQVWTDAIRQFPNVKAFEYGKRKEHGPTCSTLGPLPYTPELDSDEESENRKSAHDLPTIPHPYYRFRCVHVPRERVCRILPDHPHDAEEFDLYDDEIEAYHPSSVCALNAIRTQAGLIEPISACIKAADLQPETLIFSSALTTFERESPLPPALQNLDLSRLSSLEWRAQLFEDGTHYRAPTDELNIFLTALLQQCHLSLQTLHIVAENSGEHGIGWDSSPLWPFKQIKQVTLPNLRQLHLKGSVNARNLALWISSLPRLQNVTVLCGVDAAENGLWNWRFALDAMRIHPSLLQVRLELASLWLLDMSKLVVAIRTCTRNATKPTEREVRMSFGDRWRNKYDLGKEGNSLCRWLEGEECEWDPRLDTFFPVRDALPWE